MQHHASFVSAMGVTLGAAGVHSLPDLDIWLSRLASAVTIISGTVAIIFAIAAYLHKKR